MQQLAFFHVPQVDADAVAPRSQHRAQGVFLSDAVRRAGQRPVALRMGRHHSDQPQVRRPLEGAGQHLGDLR